MSLGIFVSRNAWIKMKDIIKFSPKSKGFLYYVTSGGCNGFNFNLKLLDVKKHYIYEDYSKGQFENKFTFKIDSSLATSCGCGISFAPIDS